MLPSSSDPLYTVYLITREGWDESWVYIHLGDGKWQMIRCNREVHWDGAADFEKFIAGEWTYTRMEGDSR